MNRLCLAAATLAFLPGCASRHHSAPDGQARALERLKEPVRMAAEGYIASLNDLARVLSGVTDTARARESMPRLEGLLANLSDHWRTLDAAGPSTRAEARYAFWQALDAASQSFEAQVARIKGTPGVGSALSGLLDKVPRWK